MSFQRKHRRLRKKHVSFRSSKPNKIFSRQLRDALNHVPAMLFLFDKQGLLHGCNAAFTKEFGWDTGSICEGNLIAEMLPHPRTSSHMPTLGNDDKPQWKTRLLRTRRGNEVFTHCTTLRLPSGLYLGMCVNIDKEARLEHENALVRERLEYVLEGGGLGSWDWDLKTNEVRFDKRWCTMLGLDPTTTPQTLATWSERVHPDDLAQATADIQRHLKGETSLYENVHRMRHSNGSWVYILDRGRISARDDKGAPLRFSGTHFDVTAQKENERELQQTKFQLEEAQSVASIGSWEFDIASGVISWSRQMFEFFPESIEQGPPSYERHVSTIFQADQLLFLQTIQRAMEDGKPYQFRYRCQKGDKLLWLEGRGRSVRDEKGTLVGLRGTCQDVTEQVELERSLELARQEAIQTAKFASLGQMAGGVAHEINNPLTILRGRADQIQMFLGSQDPSNLPDALNAIESLQRNIERIARIVRGLKAFSRDGKADPLRDERLDQIVEDTLELCRERFRNQGVKLELDISPNLRAFCRATQISQVIMNLLNNSFDAVQNSPEAWVRLTLTRHGPCARLCVLDSGPGVPHELEAKIMEPFFTTKDVGQGTGLGLSVSKGIAEQHGARLYYERHSGKGACFVFEIPLLETDTMEWKKSG